MRPIFLWPRLPLHRRHRLPSRSGLYAVVSCGRVFYVGMSKTLRDRWQGRAHHRLPQAQDLLWPYVHYIEVPESRLRAAELRLKHRVKPPWNDTKVPRWRWSLWELASVGMMVVLVATAWSLWGWNWWVAIPVSLAISWELFGG